MSLFADALQPFFVPGLNQIHGRAKLITLTDLIGRQTQIGFDLEFDEIEGAIITDFRDSGPIVDAMAFDSSRFASASFQSIRVATCGILEKETLAWSLVQAYYASFYACHAIIRILGESCSYFDKDHVRRILALGTATGKVPNFNLRASAYRCTLNSAATIVSSRSLRDGAGGAHEVFWSVFGTKVARLGEDILVGPLGENDRQIIFSKMEDFRRMLSTGGAPLYSFTSLIRNDIQYRHSRNVWIPTSLRRSDRESFARLLGQWRRDPLAVDLSSGNLGQLGSFIAISAFTVSLCVCLLQRIADRSASPAKSFARLGPLALLS